MPLRTASRDRSCRVEGAYPRPAMPPLVLAPEEADGYAFPAAQLLPTP
jgi:hypothetical protein